MTKSKELTIGTKEEITKLVKYKILLETELEEVKKKLRKLIQT